MAERLRSPFKGAALRRLFASPAPIVLAGAHDGLSARLVEEARFDAVWASGFEISASSGVPDASILTMTETLAAARLMNDAVSIPIVADCDTGFGNAINAIRTVRAFEAAGLAGLSIEDNVYPKRCSFYPGVKRLLADIDEQALKIRAARDAGSRDFVIVARTEALIAGWGLDEALRRGRAYADAGADAILIHSNHSTADDIAQFAADWDRLTPLVCVPTTYTSATVEELSRIGFKMIIFANHGLRAAIRAMQDTLGELRRAGTASAIEDRIVPLTEVYRLVNLGQLKADEREYLPPDAESVKAVILAAGFDERLMPLISDRPKAMLDVRGKPILERQIDALRQTGVRQIAVVRGYKKEQVTLPNVRYYDNDAFEESGELESLLRAGAELSGAVVVMYGDILFDRNILERLLQSGDDITLVCDRSWPDTRAGREAAGCDLVVESPAPRRHHRFLADAQPVTVSAIGATIDPALATAEFIGMAKLSARGCQILGEVYRELREQGDDRPVHESRSLRTAKLTDLLHEVIRRGHPIASVGIYQGWLEVDTFDDYRRAWTEVG
ncbi:MAG TPA: isocitrate lyase/phosphoenolpyruvate mutase family protein [Vicinamibacterales bacterium]|jgi:phosphoenolpyruvate phosphomutase|nr:isocitrate lyase/phosphoenolpyruvate mutase family protein [Vicinamibacterales bacterium]